jgi:hypothetical protein
MTCILNSVKMKSKTVVYEITFITVAEAMAFVKAKHSARWLNAVVTILP